MSYKDFAKSEIDILKHEIDRNNEYMDNNPDEFDADYIGYEIALSEKMCILLDNVLDTLQDRLNSNITREEGLYFTGILTDIFNGIPLSDLHSYEDNPEEWVEWKNCQINQRYSNFVRRTLKLVDEDGNEKEQLFYTDYTRFSFYNLITNKKIGIGDTGVAVQLTNALDQIIPITFPYNVKKNKIKIYIELFECPLQEGVEPVKTLSLTHYMPKHAEKPERIMRFFDITNKVMNEIDTKAYLTRRQIFEKQQNEEGGENNEN